MPRLPLRTVFFLLAVSCSSTTVVKPEVRTIEKQNHTRVQPALHPPTLPAEALPLSNASEVGSGSDTAAPQSPRHHPSGCGVSTKDRAGNPNDPLWASPAGSAAAETSPRDNDHETQEIECAPGRLAPEQILPVLRAKTSTFRECYAQNLRNCPSLSSRVRVQFVILSDGSVAGAREHGSTIADPAVTKCVVEAFSQLSFPKPKGGCVKVTFPIVFSPSG